MMLCAIYELVVVIWLDVNALISVDMIAVCGAWLVWDWRLVMLNSEIE